MQQDKTTSIFPRFHSGGAASVKKSTITVPITAKPEVVLSPSVKSALDALAKAACRQIIEESIDKIVPKGTQFELAIATNQPMRRVVIESPLSPANGFSFESNQDYARRCMKDSLDRGEAPYASHLLYTQMLDDFKADERQLGMEAGFLWGEAAMTVAVYTDRGISSGMIEGIKRAHARGATIVYRSLPNELR